MSKKGGRTGTPFQAHGGWGVCCLPGRGKDDRPESRLAEASVLASQRWEMELRQEEPGLK